jgi:hypothetical protein
MSQTATSVQSKTNLGRPLMTRISKCHHLAG